MHVQAGQEPTDTRPDHPPHKARRHLDEGHVQPEPPGARGELGADEPCTHDGDPHPPMQLDPQYQAILEPAHHLDAEPGTDAAKHPGPDTRCHDQRGEEDLLPHTLGPDKTIQPPTSTDSTRTPARTTTPSSSKNADQRHARTSSLRRAATIQHDLTHALTPPAPAVRKQCTPAGLTPSG